MEPREPGGLQLVTLFLGLILVARWVGRGFKAQEPKPWFLFPSLPSCGGASGGRSCWWPSGGPPHAAEAFVGSAKH